MVDLPEFLASSDRFVEPVLLGQGGFGDVYRVFDRERGAVVALKTLTKSNPGALFRFKREFRAICDVSHPNLITPFELFAEGDSWFFTMPFVEGQHFLDYWDKRQGGWPVLRRLLRQVVDGVDALHQRGMLHRDIKSSNLLVTEDGQVFVADFGLVAESNELAGTEKSLIIGGTPMFVSPEQGMGLPLTPESDWYSLGVLLYLALCGVPPVQMVASFEESIERKTTVKPLTPTLRNPNAPQDLSALCLQLLSIHPQQRPCADEIRHVVAAKAESERRADHSGLSTLFVGRDAEIEALQSAFDRARGGHALSVFVSGAAGVGKSALCRQFLIDVREFSPNTTVITGRCFQRESVPFRAVDQLIDNLTSHLVRLAPSEVEALLPRQLTSLAALFPVFRRIGVIDAALQQRQAPDLDAQKLRHQAFIALRELFGRMSARRALVLFIDDLQWADPDSVELLRALMLPPDAPSLLLLGTYRTEDLASNLDLARLWEYSASEGVSGELHQIGIAALTAEDAHDLALVLLGGETDADEAVATKIAKESSGNPLFVTELVNHARARGLTERSGEYRLNDVIATRVAQLTPAGQECLKLLATAGHAIDVSVLREALSVHTEDFSKTETALGAENLIRLRKHATGAAMELYHHGIGAALSSQMPQEESKQRHLQLAALLSSRGDTDPQVLAKHYREGGELEQARHYLHIAAERAATALAFGLAVSLYEQLLELTASDDPEQRQLRVKLGDALVKVGRGIDAAVLYLQATQESSELERRSLELGALTQLLQAGHMEDCGKILPHLLSRVGLRWPKTMAGALAAMLLKRARIRSIPSSRFLPSPTNATDGPGDLTLEKERLELCWVLCTAVSSVDPVRGAIFQGQHLLSALKVGDPVHLARALTMEVAYLTLPGGIPSKRAQQFTELMQRHITLLDDPYTTALSKIALGSTYGSRGDWPESVREMGEAAELFTTACHGAYWEIGSAEFFKAYYMLFTGDTAGIVARVPELSRSAHARGDKYFGVNLGTRITPFYYLVLDLPELAQQVSEGAYKLVENEIFNIPHFSYVASNVERLLYVGDGIAASALLDKWWPKVNSYEIFMIQSVRVEALYLRARTCLAASPQKPALLGTVAQIEKRLRKEQRPFSDAFADLLCFSRAVCQGDREQALAALITAPRHATVCGMALFAAAARWWHRELTGEPDPELHGIFETARVVNPQRFVSMLIPCPAAARHES